jgi:hypothetical protein
MSMTLAIIRAGNNTGDNLSPMSLTPTMKNLQKNQLAPPSQSEE